MRSRSMVAERPGDGFQRRCIIGARRGSTFAAREDMQAARIAVDVIMEREQLHNRWATERWQAHAVAPAGATNAAPIERLPGGGHERWRFSRLPVDLHPSESEGYYLNLTSPDPKAFVMWRRADDREPAAQPVIVTLSYNEAGRFMDGGEQVDGVPLDEALAAVLRVFVAAHYVPEPRRKVRRNDPFAADAPAASRRGSTGDRSGG